MSVPNNCFASVGVSVEGSFLWFLRDRLIGGQFELDSVGERVRFGEGVEGRWGQVVGSAECFPHGVRVFCR